jgi:hypothetical protein
MLARVDIGGDDGANEIPASGAATVVFFHPIDGLQSGKAPRVVRGNALQEPSIGTKEV